MTWQQEYIDHFYGVSAGFIDGTTEFHQLVGSSCRQGARILEIGAGPSNPTSRYLSSLGELHGADVDPAVRENDALVSAAVMAGETIPYPADHFDACVSNYVCEHLSDPNAHLAEIRRLLKVGGVYLFRTPNQYHYVAGVSRLTPQWFHELVANPIRGRSKEEHDPYPTYYRMNTKRRVYELALKTGFTVEGLRLVEKEPSYAMFSRVMFLACTAYERLVNSTEALAQLRSNLFVVLRRT